MDSNGRTQPFLVGLLIISVISCLNVKFVLSQTIIPRLLDRKGDILPAFLLISHNAKPLIISYKNTKLVNVQLVLNFTDFGS